jgi:cytochrome c oxidase assembly factor CtaG
LVAVRFEVEGDLVAHDRSYHPQVHLESSEISAARRQPINFHDDTLTARPIGPRSELIHDGDQPKASHDADKDVENDDGGHAVQANTIGTRTARRLGDGPRVPSRNTLVAMRVDPGPLTGAAVVQTWHLDLISAVVIAVLASAYAWCYRRGRNGERPVEPAQAGCFGVGMVLWVLATLSVIGTYAYVLFWVRALQVLLLLYVVPFFLAQGRPVTVVRDALGPAGRDRIDRLLASRWARALAHPLTTSVAMLAAPWLLYLTPWYTAALESEWIGAPTRILLVVIGFGYFYARLQADLVPRRYSQLISLLISVGETLGDGVLGLVIWQGSLIGTSYYAGLQRTWGPDPRLDQTIGAGVLWILGDVVGLPFVLLLMRALSRDEKAHAVVVDAELDTAEAAESESAPPSALWWENDPQLRDRFRRG